MPIKLTKWVSLNFEGADEAEDEADDEADRFRRSREADEAGASRGSEDVPSIILVYGL
jgi:hypothetical protein